MRRLSILAALMAASAITPAAAAPAASGPVTFGPATLSGLGARNIGSATMSGRIAALAARAEPDGKTLILVGAASGGVWKSTDGGTTFRPIFDKQDVQSIGALALDPNHPNTYWAGTGEAWMRNSVSIGDGIYKSVDGGETWANMGLPTSEHIARIIVDPANSDTVYACVPGRLWSDSADRGLYKTTDGGQTWSRILKGPNLSTGCASIAQDPRNPNKLFATLWDFRRKGWTFRSGGENANAPSGSGIFVTTDGGATWTPLTADGANGLPAGPWGREAVAIAPSDPNIVYAFIEGTRSALFRSDDGGKTWKERDRSQAMVWRPFYFASLTVDPKDPNRLFKPDLQLIVSDDGGKSFTAAGGGMTSGGGGTHGDHHAEWIDPTNTKHVITGDDGGLWISWDGGSRWIKNENLPISQFYHVSVDDKDPYQVYGGLQDNSAWAGDSAYPGGITNGRWENLTGGDGFWSWADPADPEHYAYVETQGGSVTRVNRQTLESRDIQPKSATTEKLRFNWNTPLVVSPNDRGTVYIGAQYLFRSRDHGQNWERISPDLTTNDKQKQLQEESGGITVDNSAAEMHTTIYTISESPRRPGMIWVGTDDGNIQLTQDSGASWTNLTRNLAVPPASWASWIEASPYDPAIAYVAIDRHTFGDFDPYIFKTTDSGRTWKRIAGPQSGMRGFAHVIKEDPERPGLLYAGTEFGLWVSLDGGAQWAQFKGGGLPSVPVRDLAFQRRDHDLVVATHGRGIWIVDDLTPLRALTTAMLRTPLTFLPSRPAQQRIEANGGWASGDAQFSGDNPADGAVFAYYEPGRHLIGKLKIEILDPAGKVIETPPASKKPGVNRVVWSMRSPAPRTPPAAQVAFGSVQGARWLPGAYTVRLTSGTSVMTTPLTVTLDRRATYTLADRQAQFAAAQRIGDLFGRMTDLAARINAVRTGADRRAAALPDGDTLKAGLADLSAKADVLRKEIVATKEGGAITGEERLREFTDQLFGAVANYEGAPGGYQLARIDVLNGMLAGISARFDQLASTDLAARNQDLVARKLPPITLPPPGGAGPGPGGGNPAALTGWRFALRPAEMTATGAAERD